MDGNILILFLIIPYAMAAFKVTVNPPEQMVKDCTKSEPCEFECITTKPVKECKIVLPEPFETTVIFKPGDIRNNSISGYFGKGYDNGCSIKLTKTPSKENSNVSLFKCELTPYLADQQVAIGEHKIIFIDQNLTVNITKEILDAYCTIKYVRPAPEITFTWYLGDEKVYFEPLNNTDNSTEVTSNYIRNLKWIDACKKLKCVVQPYNVVIEKKIAYKYKPVSVLSNTSKITLEPDTENINSHYFYFTIYAYPDLTLKWVINNKTYKEDESSPKYQFDKETLGCYKYEARFIIKNLREMDLKRIYYLTASNSLGITEYNIHLSNVTLIENEIDSELEIHAVTYIVIFVTVAYVIFLLFLILFALIRRVWPFESDITINIDQSTQYIPNTCACARTTDGPCICEHIV